jgi:hypothetical protein
MVLHLIGKHGRDLPQATRMTEQSMPVGEETKAPDELLAQATDLRRRLDDLPRLNLEAKAAVVIQQRWELELADLETCLSAQGP